MRSILFADNNPDFLDTRSEFLELAGYRVIKADTFDEAKSLLHHAWHPLLIFDIRLSDDDDEKDLSGLNLANMKICDAVAKIALSGYLTPEIVRELLKLQRSGQRLTVNVLSKDEGPEALIEAVNQAFDKHVGINWALNIDWKAQERFSLVSFIEPNLDSEDLLNRTEEFEHLLRRLFLEQAHIKLDRMLWKRDGRIALVVHTFDDTTPPETFILVCGSHEILTHEAQSFKKYSPRAPGNTGTSLDKQAETTHFAANTYALANVYFDNIYSIQNLYQTGPARIFKTTLNNLFENTLTRWHKEKRIVSDNKTLEDLYRERLKINDQRMPRQIFEMKVREIVKHVPALGVNITHEQGTLNIQFGVQSLSYPDPIPLLYQSSVFDRPVVLNIVPGTMSGENILTDTEGHAWLSDFSEAGLAPLLWNYTTLEAAIRFDWRDTRDLQRLYEMEYCLAVSRFSRFDMNLVEPVVKKPLRAIQSIRQRALSVVGKDESSYHLGAFFQAASRIAVFDPNQPCTPNELTRLAHILIAMAILGEKIVQDSVGNTIRQSENDDIQIDNQRVVWIRGMRLSIRGRNLDLLHYLYNRANQVCIREEIAKDVFDIDDYQNLSNERRIAEDGRINAAILRLRKKIEDDPSHPRFILTQPGVGYRLEKTPKN